MSCSLKAGFIRAALAACLLTIGACGGRRPSAPDVRLRSAANLLLIRCKPAQATVLLDGISQGSCGWLAQKDNAVKVPPGDHALEVTADRHRAYRARLRTGQMQHTLTIQLQPAAGQSGGGN